MAQLSIKDAIAMLKEKLFRANEKQKLQEMKIQNQEREQTPHADFLSKVHSSNCDDDHHRRMEHHATEFWNYYYDERPSKIIDDKPIEEHQYGTYQQRIAIENHMLDPKFAVELEEEGKVAPEKVASRTRWTSLIWVAETALEQGHNKEAEHNFRKALSEAENFSNEDLRLSRTLTGLAKSLCAQDKHEESDELYKRALEIDERIHGEFDLNLEEDFNNFAKHYLMQGKFMELEDLYQYVLASWEQSLGPSHPAVARCLNDLAVVYCQQSKCDKAEPLYDRAIDILRNDRISRPKQLATTLQNLASLHDINDRHEQASMLYEEAIVILEGQNDEQDP